MQCENYIQWDQGKIWRRRNRWTEGQKDEKKGGREEKGSLGFPLFSPGAHSSTENTSPLALVKVTPGLPPLCWHSTGVSLRNSLGHSCPPTGVCGSCWGFSSPTRSAWIAKDQQVRKCQNAARFYCLLIWIGNYYTQTLSTHLPLSPLLHSLLPLPQPPSSPPRRWQRCPASSSSSPAASWCRPRSVFPWSVSRGLLAWLKPLRELWRRVRPRSGRLVNRRSTAAPQSCSSGSQVFSRPLSTPWSPERHRLYWASLLRWPLPEWFLWWAGRIYKNKYKMSKRTPNFSVIWNSQSMFESDGWLFWW